MISAPWAMTMSPKAFRLTDALEKEEKKRCLPLEKEKIRETKKNPPLPDTMKMRQSGEITASGAMITEVIPVEKDACIAVTLMIWEAEDASWARYRLRLLPEQYAALRPSVGAVSAGLAEAFLAAGDLCDAIRKGMMLLGYGAMSGKKLSEKLRTHGFGRETAAEAAAYLKAHGYLNEEDNALRFAEQDVKKLWGPRRISEDLYARGFSRDMIARAMASLEDVDFSDHCAKVIRRKYGDVPSDPMQRKKMIASLMRLGYTSDQIRTAIAHLRNG